MNKPILFLLLLSVQLVCNAQCTQIKYYKSESLRKEVSAAKGKFSERITQNDDGSVTTEVKDLRTNEITRRESVKGEEPVGVWIVRNGNSVKEINYNFELNYGSFKCKDSIASQKITDILKDNDSLGFKTPILASGDQTIMQYVANALQFPRRAREELIQGRVFLKCTVKKDGTTDNCTILQGVHVVLDKEALRVLRELRFSSPATLNGEAQSFCFTLPINFKIQ